MRLAHKLKPGVALLTGEQLQKDGSHRVALERWQSYLEHALKAMRARFGEAVKSGRKTLKLLKCQGRGDLVPRGVDARRLCPLKCQGEMSSE